MATFAKSITFVLRTDTNFQQHSNLMKLRYYLWLGLALVAACSRPEYDISDGVNTEVTLFQDELSVPIGGLGPFTFGSVFELLDEVEGIGPLISEFFKVAPDGSVYVEEKGNIFKISAYELENRLDDPAVPQSWNAGYWSTFIGGASGILHFPASAEAGFSSGILHFPAASGVWFFSGLFSPSRRTALPPPPGCLLFFSI